MTTKEKIIRQSIEQIEEELEQINFLLTANPLGEISKIRQEAQKLVDANPTVQERMSDYFITEIERLWKREKEQFELAEKSKDGAGLIDKKIKLEFELQDLHNELYHIERKSIT